MNWSAIGAISELLGALAVLGTLIYLTIQIRQTKSELSLAIQQASENADRELGLELLRNGTLRDATRKISGKLDAGSDILSQLQKFGELSDDEASVFHVFNAIRFRQIAESIRNIDLLSEERIEILHKKIVFTYGSGPSMIWFNSYRSLQRSDLVVRYVNSLLKEAGVGVTNN